MTWDLFCLARPRHVDRDTTDGPGAAAAQLMAHRDGFDEPGVPVVDDRHLRARINAEGVIGPVTEPLAGPGAGREDQLALAQVTGYPGGRGKNAPVRVGDRLAHGGHRGLWGEPGADLAVVEQHPFILAAGKEGAPARWLA